MTQSKKIAITGGIGSGKSAFSAILREKGFSVFSCDEIYAELQREPYYLHALKGAFPDCVQNGAIEKARLSKIVFSDESQLAKLNELSHPLIIERLMQKMTGQGVCFAEVPLLYEGGFEDLFDGVIALKREKSMRVASVKKRDGLSEEEILARISRQQNEDELYLKNCIVIENNGTLSELRAKADEALRILNVSL